MGSQPEAPSAWAESWLLRTNKGLHLQNLGVLYGGSICAVFLGLSALFKLRRCRQELNANPSDRAQLYADCSKYVGKCTQRQWAISLVYLLHAFGIALVDAFIAACTVYTHAHSNQEQYDAVIWIAYALNCVGFLAIFVAVFIMFPLLQVMAFGFLLRRFGTVRTTLADYAPEVRILSTHIAQLWAMLAFAVMAWWPGVDNAFIRVTIFEAVYGSALMWQQISFAFNFRTEQLQKFEVQPLIDVRTGVKLYGQQVVASYTKAADGLPSYQTMSQVTDEKTEI